MLLPSVELAKLAERVDICLSGKTAPRGCDIRYRQMYWLIVFDAKGELVAASRLSDQLGEFTKLGLSVPEAFVAIVDEGLAAGPSLEQLERAYLKQRGSGAAFAALVEKLELMDGVGQMRVARFLKEAAPQTADPALARGRGLLVQAAACSHQVINHQAFAELRTGIEGFLEEHPGHEVRGEVVEQLVDVALKYTFDLRARCRSYADAWSSSGADSDERRELAELLLDRCKAAVGRGEEELRGMKPKAYGRLRLQARLGDAQATIDGLAATKSLGVMRPIHAEWRRDAAAKLGR